ncbi:MAG: hypothetical protein AAFV53_16660 [Myxococcota bacterium]
MSPNPPLPFQILNDALTTLHTLPPGEDAWCWMTDRGPNKRAAAVIIPQRSDPDGAAFKEDVRRTIAHTRSLGSVVMGTLRRMESGLVLMTTASPEHTLSIHAALCRNPLAFDAPDLTAVQMRGANLIARQHGRNLSEDVRILEALQDHAPRHFYLIFGAAGKRPQLLIADDEITLKARSRADRSQAPRDATRLRGKVYRSNKGHLIFRTARAQDPSALLTALVHWTTAHHRRWPALDAMVGSRVVITDESGETTQRHRDDDAWSALTDR